jgi:transcriptional regulator with XRE-family HTH domain
MSNISDILGSAARAARLRAGLTQAGLARDCALSRQTIAQFEAGTYSDLGVRKIERVLARLGLRLELAGGSALPAAAGGSRIARLLRARGLARAGEAHALAAAALRRLRKAGVAARIVGSLAKGSFRADSDVDYLIEDRGGLSEARIGDLIEAAMHGFPFDAIYADRTDPVLLRHLREEARRGAPAVRAA